MSSKIPQLILITDSRRYPDDSFYPVLEEALKAGLPAVLLREKALDSAHLLARASRLREITDRHGASLYIHSQADIARAVGADGVHVSSADIGEIASMRQWLNAPDMSVSASCHDQEQLDAAYEQGADFVFLSPVFPTMSHPGAPALGVASFMRLAAKTPLPVLALGGITVDNVALFSGFGKGVIGAVLGAEYPAESVRRLLAETLSEL